MTSTLFPTGLPERAWTEFAASGFDRPVSGAIFRAGRPPCCGVPLGGISTGCLDIDARGVYGFSSLFNAWTVPPYRDTWRVPRKLPRAEPMLGLAAGGGVWVLAAQPFIDGSVNAWCTEPRFQGKDLVADTVRSLKLEGVRPARDIHYWGHYPVADLEFETEAPVSVGLRAWAPFIPGDAAASNIPAIVFEVRLRNPSGSPQRGTIALNFPGPDSQEARATEFTRQEVREDARGVHIRAAGGWAGYVLGTLDGQAARFGGGLGSSPTAWAKIAAELPQPAFREQDGQRLFQESGCSAAIDFELQAGEEKAIRFVLAWHAPAWEGGLDSLKTSERHPHQWIGSPWEGDAHYFTQMYAARYASALDVARRVARDHQALLARVLAWQAAVYADAELPPWLRDSLINSLALIAEDSHWAQARTPLGDWAHPGGAFGLNECPRGCPQISCIPCDWYGNLPIVFFFPELARANLRAFKQFQKEDGEVPFAIGKIGDLPDLATPATYWQVSLNGTCYADLVDRLWQATGDAGVLDEFYESVKRCTTFTMRLREGPGGVISMPAIGGMEWFEFGEWAGMASHMGGLRLAHLRIAERMARAAGDAEYARQCRAWLEDGTRAMEEEMWAGGYYLNFLEKETGKRSDDVMAYQLDGEWMARYHGFAGVYRAGRVVTALDTIRRLNVALTPEVGAANFARPDGSPLPPKSQVAAYGPYAMFPPEVLVLAMTYVYAGQEAFGLDLARRHWETIALRQGHAWDLPNIVRGDTGERVYGTDYYQDMMLWALPAALAGQTVADARRPGGLVDRVIAAGNPAA
jgi:uncharacterized protein (DUF608 family)